MMSASLGYLLASSPREIAEEAAYKRDLHYGRTLTYSRKIFLPLTQLCRDVCRYCTFAQSPARARAPYMSIDEVVAVAQAGAALGCKEALFTLGDKPELRWPEAKSALDSMGYGSTLSYLEAAARAVLDRTGLTPHLNPGLMSAADLARLRDVSASMGLMLESVSERLMARGGPHFGCPDKSPTLRLQVIEEAGHLSIPFTTGLLIGIGETRRERLDALMSLLRLHERFGHIQEIIIQPFRAKPGTAMARHPDAPIEELVWTIAAARLMFGAETAIQSPPNLAAREVFDLLDAGINDFGGISPLTRDFVNPEAAWPDIARFSALLAKRDRNLVERLAVYPGYLQGLSRWASPGPARRLRELSEASGLAREDNWRAGRSEDVPAWRGMWSARCTGEVAAVLARVGRGERLSEAEVAQLFQARGGALNAIVDYANALGSEMCDDVVSYVVTRNINYTNICTYSCKFCAFSKGRVHDAGRDKPYVLSSAEVEARVQEAWTRGAVEVCLQGGIHPAYTGETYLEMVRAARRAAPEIHIHAFSPLEISHGAMTLGLSLEDFLRQLKKEGLSSLPGTAAEILDDDVRKIICPDKLSAQEWLTVMECAHNVGLRTTATIMFGHVDSPIHWARHLLSVRDLQERTGGFTEFVPLPFVADEAPMFVKGQSRRGPTFREALLMHALARLTLHPLIPNIQTSWVKMGPKGAQACLRAGANDIGGTLMNESITRAAGAQHGQEMTPSALEALIKGVGRTPLMRTTLYQPARAERRRAAFAPTPA